MSMFELPVNPVGLILFILFSFSALIQMIYFIFFYSRTRSKKRKDNTSNERPEGVSIIICAKNEVENLKNFLPSILEQEYPDFEVIVVNDCSEDGTDDILKLLGNNYPHLRVTTIHKDASLYHSKKMALFLGIKAAKNEFLLLTDADCQPVSPNWISRMVGGFSNNKDFVLGYGGFLRKKGLLNKYIRFDSMFIAMQYMGLAMAGLPYMGVGRNLAYKRSAFFENKGFGPYINLQSGDDDLFINKLANGKNCSVVKDMDSITRSIPASSFAALANQKVRRLSTRPHYTRSSRTLIATEPISRLTFYTLFTMLMFTLSNWELPLLVFGIVQLTRITVFRMVQNALNERDLLLFSPLFDIFSLFINGYFLILTRRNRNRSYEWK
jgi:glycosyltransferase involved in cell wall biosynthesis